MNIEREHITIIHDRGYWIHPCCKHEPGAYDYEIAERNRKRQEARKTASRAEAERWADELEGMINV